MDFSEFWGHNLIFRRKSGLCPQNSGLAEQLQKSFYR